MGKSCLLSTRRALRRKTAETRHQPGTRPTGRASWGARPRPHRGDRDVGEDQLSMVSEARGEMDSHPPKPPVSVRSLSFPWEQKTN